jgi:hypothetical protein
MKSEAIDSSRDQGHELLESKNSEHRKIPLTQQLQLTLEG